MDVFQDRKNLYKVRETMLEMISDRGFNIPESEKITFEQFIIKYTNKTLDMVVNDIENKKIFYVYFHNEVKNFSKADLKNIMQKISGLFIDQTDQVINIILILKDKENSAISKELSKDVYKNVEIFLKNNMVFNITHHELVPQHILLTLDEEKELLEKYNTTKGKLPKILKTDPIAKYYGAKTDQIFKIIRKSPSVGEAFYYRLVR